MLPLKAPHGQPVRLRHLVYMIGCLSTSAASFVLDHDRRISGDVFPQKRNEGPPAVISRSSGSGTRDNH